MELGTKIANRYELISLLGRGGMGGVYLAKDTKFDIQVAIKLAATEGEAIDDFKVRFAREAKISYLLGQEQGIVRALDWGEEVKGTCLYLVMDLVKGAKELELHEGPLDERLDKLERAAELVAIVHRRKLVHRDLKPGNFLVDETGELFLGDFGVAKQLGEDVPSLAGPMRTQTGALLGTPLFMAMEQFEDSKSVDQRADVYSLGVILFHILTNGQYPYPGTSTIDVINRQLLVKFGDDPQPRPADTNPGVDPHLELLCMNTTSHEVDYRPADAGQFLQQLREVRSGGKPQRKAPPRKKLRRRPSGSGRVPQAAAPKPKVPTREDLGLDDHGFTTRPALRAMRKQLGPPVFLALLGGAPALFVEHERPLKGTTTYEGKVAFAIPRSGAAGRPILVGRTPAEADIVLALPTLSTAQLKLYPGSPWRLTEEGSRNGTELNGRPLTPHLKEQVADGDRIRIAQHVTARFMMPESLSSWLEE